MTEHLLQTLRRRPNHQGLVIVRESVLLEETQLDRDALHSALRELEGRKAIQVLSPLPFLVVKLRKWSGKTLTKAGTAAKTERSDAPCYSSYSFNNNSIDKSKAIAIEDGGTGEGDELLKEILSTLGETDPTTFRGVLEHFPATKIRAVLERVRSTPPEKLRKSRTALFRYLLAKTK